MTGERHRAEREHFRGGTPGGGRRFPDWRPYGDPAARPARVAEAARDAEVVARLAAVRARLRSPQDPPAPVPGLGLSRPGPARQESAAGAAGLIEVTETGPPRITFTPDDAHDSPAPDDTPLTEADYSQGSRDGLSSGCAAAGAGRCLDCGYLFTAPGHRAECGGP